jgi:uncharacterized membrane protein YfcA
MELAHAPLLFLVAVAAGALNSVAGGGSFLSFPALIFTGVPPINANATNTFALWPGTAASTAAYRRELARQKPRTVIPLVLTAFGGGLTGAVLLLKTPQRTFLQLIPWLLLMATLLLLFSPQISAWVRHRTGMHKSSRLAMLGGALIQLFIGVYIGFFGAGAGIMMLAMLAVLGMQNIHEMNGVKTLLATVGNGVAVATFILAKAIFWPQAVLMTLGATLGGYAGAYFALKVDPKKVRWFAIATGFAMTAYFFMKTGV